MGVSWKCDCGQPIETVYVSNYGTVWRHSDTGKFQCEGRLDNARVNGNARPGGGAVVEVTLARMEAV